jgi:hypothetical protein
MPVKPAFEVMLLGKREYLRRYKESCVRPRYTKAFTRAMHLAEFQKLDRALHRTFSSRWDYTRDYEMMEGDPEFGDAFDAWMHSGGIYSNRICCPEYVQVILAAMAPLPHSEKWMYHTACELWRESKPVLATGNGEFFARNSTLFAPVDGNDYVHVFRNMA